MAEGSQIPEGEPAPFPGASAPPVVFGGRWDRVRWGTWTLLVGVLLYFAYVALGVFLSYFYVPSLASNLPVFAHATLLATAGAVVGLGVFLAALGLSGRTRDGNVRWLVGGILMFVGFLAESATQLIVDVYFYGGNPLGGDVLRTIGVMTTGMGLLLPVGLLIFFLGFLTPEGEGQVP